MAEHQAPLRRRVGKGDPLLEVRPGGGVFAKVEEGAPEHFVGLQKVRRCSLVLREPVEPFSQLS